MTKTQINIQNGHDARLVASLCLSRQSIERKSTSTTPPDPKEYAAYCYCALHSPSRGPLQHIQPTHCRTFSISGTPHHASRKAAPHLATFCLLVRPSCQQIWHTDETLYRRKVDMDRHGLSRLIIDLFESAHEVLDTGLGNSESK